MAAEAGWLETELDGVTLRASGPETADADSGDLTLAALLGGVITNRPAVSRAAVIIDVTVQGGTQASVDFNLEFKISGKYYQVQTFNTTPGGGILKRVMLPDNAGSEVLGDTHFLPWPGVFRVSWVFNTPAATPTITFSLEGIAWGLMNTKSMLQ